MDIRIEGSEGDDVALTVEFIGRPESVEGVTDRIYGLMRMYPMMRMGGLKVKLPAWRVVASCRLGGRPRLTPRGRDRAPREPAPDARRGGARRGRCHG